MNRTASLRTGVMMFFALISLLTMAFSATAKDAADSASAGKQKMVIQVSDNSPGKWNLALNNAMNAQNALGGPDKVDVEIVVYGPGIGMLKMDSEVGNRVETVLGKGVKVVACQNTMRAKKLTKDDMLPSIGYVPAGVIEIMYKQQQGYSYIRP